MIIEIIRSVKKGGNATEATDVDVGPSTRDDTQVTKDYIPAKPAFQEPSVQKKGNDNCSNFTITYLLSDYFNR